MRTVHASLDNQSDRYRMSTDTRYQPASLPIDQRWIGEDRTRHSHCQQARPDLLTAPINPSTLKPVILSLSKDQPPKD